MSSVGARSISPPSNETLVSIVSKYNDRGQCAAFASSYIDLDLSTKQYILDCLTMFRDSSWARKINRICLVQVFGVTAIVVIFFLVSIYGVTQLSVMAADETWSLLDEIQSNGCLVWLHGREPGSGVPVEPVQFSWFGVGELVLVTTPGILMCANALIRYHVAICEINSMLAEQMSRIQLAIETTNILHEMGLSQSQMVPLERNFKMNANLYSFDLLKSQLQRRVGVFVLSFLKPYNINSKAYASNDSPLQVAISMISAHGTNMYSYENLLIKIYIGNLVLIRMVSELSDFSQKFLMISVLINYTSIASVIHFIRKLEEYNLMPMIFAFTGVVFNCFITFYASVVNGLSKRMLTSMWRLVTAAVNFQDIRVMHVRSLLVRQVVYLNEEGGLMFKALGMNVNYGTVIKLALWSSTIVVVSFSL